MIRKALSWLPEALFATVLALPFLAEPAYAYVDPSVMTYTIQALAGVAVALSAVAGVALRKTRKKVFALLKIDENSRKEVEPDIHRVVDGLVVPNAGEDADAFVAHQAQRCDVDASRSRNAEDGRRAGVGEKLRWRARLGYGIVAAGYLSYTVLAVAPFELVAANADSLVVDAGSVWMWMVLLAAVVAAVLGFVLSALRGRAFMVGFAVVLAVGVCCYLQALLMNQGLPAADGSTVQWRDFAPIAAGTGAVWLAVIAASVVFSRFRPRLWRVGGVVVACALMVVQGAGVASLAISSGAFSSDEAFEVECTEEGLFELSPKGNVVVFVLDTYDTRFLDSVRQADPKALAPFEDFTWFRNATGSMIPTRYAVPSLLTGQTPATCGSFDEFLRNAYGDSGFLREIRDAGFSVGLYSDSLGLDSLDPDTRRGVSELTMNVAPAEKSVDALGAMGILARCALYRDMPWVLKPWFWYYTDELNAGMVDKAAIDDDGELYLIDDAAYADKLRERGLSLDDSSESGAFRFIHLLGAHEPYTLDERGRKAKGGKSTFERQLCGSLRIVGDYLERMKQLGVYDSSTVVVTADHGEWYLTDQIDGPTSPIVMVKPAKDISSDNAASAAPDGGKAAPRAPLVVSEAPVSHFDLQATILEAIGCDVSGYGETVFDQTDPDRRRLYYMTASDGKQDRAIKEFEISGDALDFSSWRLTGREWEIPPEE